MTITDATGQALIAAWRAKYPGAGWPTLSDAKEMLCAALANGKALLSNELLPCPVCGSAFLISQEPHDNHLVAGKFYIFHEYGPIGSAARACPIDVPKHFDTREEAIAAWNRRAPDPELLAARRTIEEMTRPSVGEHHKLDTDKQVFFYEQDFYVLSNFSAFNLKWHGRTFPTSEHAYHWSRFVLGWDLTDAAGMDAAPVAVRIMAAPSAHEAFKLAQEYRDLQHPNWVRDKIDTMRRILRAKAEQHQYVRRKLLATGERELIEDSWRDEFWGWGPNRDGHNMLGKLWMEVRSELRAALSNSGEQVK